MSVNDQHRKQCDITECSHDSLETTVVLQYYTVCITVENTQQCTSLVQVLFIYIFIY